MLENLYDISNIKTRLNTLSRIQNDIHIYMGQADFYSNLSVKMK